jgi:hypothetical protein
VALTGVVVVMMKAGAVEAGAVEAGAVEGGGFGAPDPPHEASTDIAATVATVQPPCLIDDLPCAADWAQLPVSAPGPGL